MYGGMDSIIDGFEIGEIYIPYSTRTDLLYYRSIEKSINNKNIELTNDLIADYQFHLGEAICTIMTLDNNEPKDPNEASITIELDYKDIKYLFMGDATTKVENSRAWNKVDILKVGHHRFKNQ